MNICSVSYYSLALKSAFPFKTEEEIQELLEAAGYKTEYDSIMYKPLFFEVSYSACYVKI